MDTRLATELPGITAESFRLHGRLQPPPAQIPVAPVQAGIFTPRDGIRFHGSSLGPEFHNPRLPLQRGNSRVEAMLLEHLDTTYDFVMSSDPGLAADVVYDIYDALERSNRTVCFVQAKRLQGHREERGSSPGTFLTTLIETAVGARPSVTVPPVEAEPDGLPQSAGRLHRYSASQFIQRMARLESGFLLRRQFAKVRPQEAQAPIPPGGPEIEPLAVACGITRLTVPLAPRAPGLSGPTTAEAHPRALNRVPALAA
ncbi:hypothetical protein ACWDD9_20230 [Kitasatospora sp. NPDC001119]